MRVRGLAVVLVNGRILMLMSCRVIVTVMRVIARAGLMMLERKALGRADSQGGLHRHRKGDQRNQQEAEKPEHPRTILPSMFVMRMHDRVPLTASDQPAVHRKRRHRGHGE